MLGSVLTFFPEWRNLCIRLTSMLQHIYKTLIELRKYFFSSVHRNEFSLKILTIGDYYDRFENVPALESIHLMLVHSEVDDSVFVDLPVALLSLSS